MKLLKAIKDKMDQKWPPASGRMSGDGEFFDNAYAALSGMQNPWRNATGAVGQALLVLGKRAGLELWGTAHGAQAALVRALGVTPIDLPTRRLRVLPGDSTLSSTASAKTAIAARSRR